MRKIGGILGTLVALTALAAACAGPTVDGAGGGDERDTPAPGESGTPAPGTSPTPGPCRADEDLFAEPWIDGDGGDCATEPDIQAQRVDANTWVLRQSLCTNYEGPFLYLLFGEEKVLLEDTGAGGVDVRGAVEGIVAQWLAEHAKTGIQRIVVNSHAHGDHTAGNASFQNKPDTTVVGTSVAAVQSFFGIANWPTDIATYDLGGRVIDVIPIPGHQAAHIALYDHATRWLLTGDTLYPGRLYVSNFPAYVASLERLVAFAEELEVCQVMGTHIEMTATAGVDFPFGSTYHPDEHALPLSREHLLELRDAAVAMQANPVTEAHDDFILSP